jgi:hypothetical protein
MATGRFETVRIAKVAHGIAGECTSPVEKGYFNE